MTTEAGSELGLETGWSRRRALAWVVSLVGVLAVPVCWSLLARHHDGSCRSLRQVANFAGSAKGFVELATKGRGGDCGLADLDSFRTNVVLCLVFAAVYGALLFLVCWWWWDDAWLTRRFIAAKPVAWLAPVAAVCDVITLVVQLFAVHLRTSGGVRSVSLDGGIAWLLPTLSWVKVFAFSAVSMAALFTLIAVFSRRRLPVGAARAAEQPYADAPVEGFGIACSGGGIRAASLSLGALGVLERSKFAARPEPDAAPVLEDAEGTAGLLYRAKYLASVSGGGYTAGGWRAASASTPTGMAASPVDEEAFVERWPAGVIGDPQHYPELPPRASDSYAYPGDPSLYRHLQQRREFLRSSRGGLPASLILALLFLVFHLALIATVIVVVAYPIGRLASTWFVLGDDPTISAAAIVDRAGRQLTLEPRLYAPALIFAGIAVVVFVACLFQWNTALRGRLMAIGWGFTAAALSIGALLIGVPWMLDVVYPFVRDNASVNAIAALASAGGAIGVIVGVAKRFLLPKLVYLGGVLLALGAGVLALWVAGQAATGHGFFTLSWIHRVRGVTLWSALLLALVIGYFVLCPRWWSLHTLYRNRLRTAFITTRQPELSPWGVRRSGRRFVGAPSSDPREDPRRRLWPIRKYSEPLVDTYVDAPGPQHLVCCAAARTDTRASGVKALSFVIDPVHVELHDIGYTATGLATTTFRTNTPQWVQALGSERARRAEGTISAAISISGAAVAPSMGRMNVGSTNALIAALNLRLGTWFPNPRYVPLSGTTVRYPWVRLWYVLKEMLGYFDLLDHHLYVTDGGHRENLGLVELLRRRCKTMICVDSSGDSPGSFTTLRQAAEMARLEVGASLDLRALPEKIVPRPPAAHTLIPVTYRDDAGTIIGTGTVIHIAALMFEGLPNDLIAYGLEDVHFPSYSTGDQFLTEEQFRRLVLFGNAATITALEHEDVRRAIAEAIDPTQPATPTT